MKWFLFLFALSTLNAHADFASYFQSSEANYGWKLKKVVKPVLGGSLDGNTEVLEVKSIQWKNTDWTHNVTIYLPKNLKNGSTAIVHFNGTEAFPTDEIAAKIVSNEIKAPYIIIDGVPNQPLFQSPTETKGYLEDGLIAYTFQKYFQTGDDTWPALFPMAKSASLCMTAAQEYLKKAHNLEVKDFIPFGWSKRGWTTYLLAKEDPRVAGMVIMGFDALHLGLQLERQIELWGELSPMISEYSSPTQSLADQFLTKRGYQLLKMIDPYFHLDKYKMPKLIISASNDPFWATDSTLLTSRLFEGDTYFLTVANSGHEFLDRRRVYETMVAFFLAYKDGKKLPQPNWELKQNSEDVELAAQFSETPYLSRVWKASREKDNDFRGIPYKFVGWPTFEETVYKEDAVKSTSNTILHKIAIPETGSNAAFIEARYKYNGKPYSLTTPLVTTSKSHRLATEIEVKRPPTKE